MLTISQHGKTGHQQHERIIVRVTQGKHHFSSLRVTPAELKITGCSLRPETLPPGLVLLRHRERFDVFGVAMYKGNWGGLLCVDTDYTLFQKQLFFVVT